jgi:large subunit ribosomal protein L35
MPKAKTRQAAAKRFKKTGTGKLSRMKAYTNHFMSHKSAKAKRNLRQPTLVDSANLKAVKRMLPNL